MGSGLPKAVKKGSPSRGRKAFGRFIRTHLKNVFWPHIFVGASFQILDIQQYACGLKLGPAAIWNRNPIFELASSSIGFIRSIRWLRHGDDKNFEGIKCGKALRELTNKTNETNETA